jgi:hypothetical protein
MRTKKPIRMKKASRARTTKRSRSKKTTPPWWTRPLAVGGGVATIMLGAVLLGAYDASSRADFALAHMTRSAAAAPDVAPEPASAPATTPARDAFAADAAVSEESAAPSAAVTLVGCLERSDDSFRLKDTSGTSAPKARSWKSGFLRKGAAPVAVIDQSKRLNLTSHVGERVSVTGTLVDREMHVRSLQRVATSCDARGKMKA